MIHALYFNGLGSGRARSRERIAVRYLARHGIHVTHIPINWRNDESFSTLLARTATKTQAALQEHDHVLLIGVSAGGSLALNIFGKLKDERVSVVMICSRLRLAQLPWWDKRTLERMAFLGTPQASQSFFDSVTHCSNVTIPNLTQSDRSRIITVQQWCDDIVPKPTMDIPGVQVYSVPGIRHAWGIMSGTVQLPHVVEMFVPRLQ